MQHPIDTINSWKTKSFFEQLANIGSEVHRTISWKIKQDLELSRSSFDRSLELIDLTLDCKLTVPELKELCKIREFWIDYYLFDNLYKFTDEYWESYFYQITYAYAMSKI